MLARRRRTQGFTLVEILIVVVILGILAAVVIPQFTSASETAKQASLTTQLQTIRSQLELYQVQHNGQYPKQAEMEGFMNLVKTTDVNGSVDGDDFGPYLMKPPGNPFTAGPNAALVGASASADVGWVYNGGPGEGDGRIRACLSWQVADGLALSSDDVATY